MRKLLRLTISIASLAVFTHQAGAALGDAVDSTNLSWDTGGDSSWVPVNTTGAFDGVDMAQSGVINGSQVSWIQTTVTGPGTLSFWWRVSSESNQDFLEFSIDGNLMKAISGTSPAATVWQYGLYTIDSG